MSVAAVARIFAPAVKLMGAVAAVVMASSALAEVRVNFVPALTSTVPALTA
jgi:hypothetical protein